MADTTNKWSRANFVRTYSFAHIPEIPDRLLLTIDGDFEATNITGEDQPYFAKIEFEPDEGVREIYHTLSIDGVVLFDKTTPLTDSPTRKGILEARTDEVIVPAGKTLIVHCAWVGTVTVDGKDLMSFGKPIYGVTVKFRGLDGIDCLAEFAQEPTDARVLAGVKTYRWDYTFIEWQHINVRWWKTEAPA